MIKIYNFKLLNTIINIHNSEKSNIFLKKFDIITFEVNKNSNKIDIKNAFKYIFNLKIKKINIVVIKKKLKKNNKNVINFKKTCKKAFVFLKSKQNLNYLDKLNEIYNKKIISNNNE